MAASRYTLENERKARHTVTNHFPCPNNAKHLWILPMAILFFLRSDRL